MVRLMKNRYQTISIKTWRKVLEEYCNQVISGEVKVNHVIRKAVERYYSFFNKYEFVEEKVVKAIKFFKELKHVRGEYANSSFTLLPWQLFLIANIFGWYKDGNRLIRKVFVSVARKNGKSSLAAGLALKLLLADNEVGPQVMCVATSREQARIVFQEAALMLQKSRVLNRLCEVFKTEIRCSGNNGVFWASSADCSSLWGYSLSGAIVDELHAHKTRGIWEATITSMVSRKKPLLVVISTSGQDEARLFSDLREYTEGVVNGVVEDDSFFGLDYYLESDNWKDSGLWQQANPSLGHTLRIDDLENIRKICSESVFRRYHLNQTIANEQAWIPLDVWRKGNISSPPEVTNRPCYVGVDLASTTDLSAVVLVFPFDNGEYYVDYKAFTCRYAVTNSPRSKLYQRFVELGELEVAGEDVINENAISNFLLDCYERYNILGVYFDPSMSSGIIQRLAENGIPESDLIAVPPKSNLLDPLIRETERHILSGNVKHLPSELFEYCVTNSVVTINHLGYRKLSKAKSTGPIDLAYALVLALGNTKNVIEDQIGVVWL